MNDPTDDEKLSSLYGRASTEQPSKSADDSVMARAKQEIEKTQVRTSYYPGWTQSLSVAAVVVLSVTVLFMIEKESPEIFQDGAPVVIEQKTIMGKKVMEQPVIEQEALKQERKTTDKIKENELAKKPASLQEKFQPKKSGFMDYMTSPHAPSRKTVAKINEIVTSKPALNQTVPAKTKARKKLETPTMESDSEVARFARPAQTPRAMMGIAADRADEDTIEGLSCQQLTEKTCLTSAACSLKKTKDASGYQCLPAKDHCELMFRQSEGTKESCEAKQGCEFVPAQCYCHPDVLCECGGGEPKQCRSK